MPIFEPYDNIPCITLGKTFEHKTMLAYINVISASTIFFIASGGSGHPWGL